MDEPRLSLELRWYGCGLNDGLDGIVCICGKRRAGILSARLPEFVRSIWPGDYRVPPTLWPRDVAYELGLHDWEERNNYKRPRRRVRILRGGLDSLFHPPSLGASKMAPFAASSSVAE